MNSPDELRFPAATKKAIGNTKIYTERKREKLIVPQKVSNYPHFQALKSITPVDDQFGFPIENGSTLVPVHVFRGLFEDTRGTLRKLLTKVPAGLQEFNMPVGYPKTGQTYFQPGPSERGALFLPREGERELPHEAIALRGQQLGQARLVEMARKTHYWLQRLYTGTRIQRSEGGDANTFSPWLQEKFPELCTVLKAYGERVFEAGPSDADRVLVCFKHFHGSVTSVDEFDSIRKGIAESFVQHQHDLTNAVTEIIRREGFDRVRVFLESFPARVDSDYLERPFVQQLNNAARSHPLQQCLDVLKQGMDLDDPATAREIILANFIGVSDRILAVCEEAQRTDILFGDGRVERDAIRERQKAESEHAFEQLLPYIGEMGVAGGMGDVDRVASDRIYHEQHRYLTTKVASELKKHQIGLLIYGAAHFASGMTKDDAFVRHFEEYLAFLPRTHLVVLEGHQFAPVDRAFIQLRSNIQEFSLEEINLFETAGRLLDTSSTILGSHYIGHSDEPNVSDLLAHRKKARASLRRVHKRPPIVIQEHHQLESKPPDWAS